jgi:hypothetical protein
LYSADYRYSRQFPPRFQEQSTGTFGTEIKATPKPAVQGIFDILLAGSFPATHPKCAVFCRLYLPDQRKCIVSLVMETPVLVTKQLMAPRKCSPKPNGVVQLTCNIEKLVLTHEGIYTLKLIVDGKAMSEFHLTVSYRDVSGRKAIADRSYGFTADPPAAPPTTSSSGTKSAHVAASASKDTVPPLVSGRAIVYKDNVQIEQWALSEDQLTELSKWLKRNRSGWKKTLGAATLEPCVLCLDLKRADRKTRSISVKARRDGSQYLLLQGGKVTDDPWPEQSRWSIFKTRRLLQPIADHDLAVLQASIARSS